jgi:hypothetical protein
LNPARIAAASALYQSVTVMAAEADRRWAKAEEIPEDSDIASHVAMMTARHDEVRGELRRIRGESGLGHQVPEDISPVDAALALGPGAGWWENGAQAGIAAGVVGAPFGVYLTWAAYRADWAVIPTRPLGLLNFATDLLAYILLFAFTGFVLGCLWRELPFTRGVFKALPLIAAYGGGAATDALLRVATGGERPDNTVATILVLLIVLTATGAIMDIRSLRAGSRPWTSWTVPVVWAYRLSGAGGTVGFVLAQLGALVGLWTALRSGLSPGETPTPSGPAGRNS